MGTIVFSDRYQVSGVGRFEQNIRLSYTELYDPALNRSAVTITGIEIASSLQMGSVPVYGTVQIDGTTVVTLGGAPGNTANISGGAASYRPITNAGGETVYVTHDDTGAGSMSVCLTGGMNGVFGARYNGRMYGVRTAASQRISLTAHPRASAIASCSSPVPTLGTLSLSVERSSPAFFHKARFLCGGTLLAESAAFAAALSFTVPRSWFAAYPAAASLPVTLCVQTYSDESCAEAVGSPATAEISVCADALMRPKLSEGWVTLTPYNAGAAAGLSGYVEGYSRAEAVFDPAKIDLSDTAGASIASFSVSGGGSSASESPYRTGLLSPGDTVVCSVTDTRGRTASESFSLPVMDYAKPTLGEVAVFRCRADGTADEGGTYYSVRATPLFSLLGGENSCALGAALAPSGGSFGAETALTSGTARLFGPISADASFSVRVRAEDRLGGSAVYYATLPTRKWAMKFRSGGRGVAFGKAAETDDVFEIASDWELRLGRPLAVACGGTGASSTAGAKSNLGLANVENERQYSAQNPPPYPVTSVNGQTGAVTVPTGSRATLLWTNPSPTSSFGAQTLSLDLSGYSWVCVKVKVSAAGTSRTPDCFFSVDDVIHYIYMMSVTNNRTGGRTFQYDTVNKTVSFGAASYNAASNNTYAIPLEIWGVNL